MALGHNILRLYSANEEKYQQEAGKYRTEDAFCCGRAFLLVQWIVRCIKILEWRLDGHQLGFRHFEIFELFTVFNFYGFQVNGKAHALHFIDGAY